MSTKYENLMNKDSCLSQAETHEPIFVLRANDPHAPETVREWARRYRIANGGGNGSHQMPEDKRAKWASALAVATDMEDWKRKQR